MGEPLRKPAPLPGLGGTIACVLRMPDFPPHIRPERLIARSHGGTGTRHDEASLGGVAKLNPAPRFSQRRPDGAESDCQPSVSARFDPKIIVNPRSHLFGVGSAIHLRCNLNEPAMHMCVHARPHPEAWTSRPPTFSPSRACDRAPAADMRTRPSALLFCRAPVPGGKGSVAESLPVRGTLKAPVELRSTKPKTARRGFQVDSPNVWALLSGGRRVGSEGKHIRHRLRHFRRKLMYPGLGRRQCRISAKLGRTRSKQCQVNE